MPGQALGYQFGSLKFWELRRRAAKLGGPDFNVRDFHEAILSEGCLPFAVLEALVLKKPVLLSDCIGNRDIVHKGLNGDLFKNEDEAIIKILQYHNNRDMLNVMGEYSQQFCEKEFDVHSTFTSYRDLYKS